MPTLKQRNRLHTFRKILITLVVLGVVAAIAGFGVFAAFSATTDNSGNSIASGTVAIGDNDGGSASLYSLSDAKPGDAESGCIRVTYTGSLGATVKLYTSSGITNGTDFNLKVERGSGLSGAFPACTGFTAAGTLYDGDISTFGTDYTGGVNARGSTWAQNDAVDYRFTITQKDDTTANAHTSVTGTGAHTFTWEARTN
jgi:hypothetical protein